MEGVPPEDQAMDLLCGCGNRYIYGNLWYLIYGTYGTYGNLWNLIYGT